MLRSPIVFDVSEDAPIAVLQPPVVLFSNALFPIAVLLFPIVLEHKALYPRATFAVYWVAPKFELRRVLCPIAI